MSVLIPYVVGLSASTFLLDVLTPDHSRMRERKLGQAETADKSKAAALHGGEVSSDDPGSASKKDKEEDVEVVIIGGSAAGISAGACLNYEGVSNVVVNNLAKPGDMWRGRYDRLHLHNIAEECQLPLQPMPDSYPTFPSRKLFADYLDSYKDLNRLNYYGGYMIESAKRQGDNRWVVKARKTELCPDPKAPDEKIWYPQHVCISNGMYNEPHIPDFNGLDKFKGDIIHSSKYTNGGKWKGKKVLLIGFGNSGAEIAVDLWEHGANTSILVRSKVLLIPRNVMQSFENLLYYFHPLRALLRNTITAANPFSLVCTVLILAPFAIALDVGIKIAAYIQVGDLTKQGIRQTIFPGPLLAYTTALNTPVMDVGTVDLIKKGEISILNHGVKEFEEHAVVLEDGSRHEFDAVVLATGFKTIEGHMNILEKDICDHIGSGKDSVLGQKIRTGHSIKGIPNLWFVSGRLQAIRDAAPCFAEQLATATGRTSRFGRKHKIWMAKLFVSGAFGVYLGYAVSA